MKQFDRAEIDHILRRLRPNDNGGAFSALALALAVVDKAVKPYINHQGIEKGGDCCVCGGNEGGGEHGHAPDCPVLACVEKGLAK